MRSIMRVNLYTPFFLSRALLPQLRGWVRLIHIGSAHNLVASPNKAAYCAAKHGVLGFSTLRVFKETRGRTFIDTWVADYQLKIPPEKIHWPSLISQAMEFDSAINEKNFGGILMMLCMKHSTFAVAKDYMDYDKKPTLATLSGFLRISTEYREPADPGYLSLIVEVYDKLKTKCKGMWDIETGDRAIQAICLTKRWREALEILEVTKIGGNPLPSSYDAIASAAFENKENELGWETLHLVSHRRVGDKPLITWLNHCEPTEENMVKVLEFMDLYEHYPAAQLAREIKYFFESKLKKYKGVETIVVPGRGVCKNCLNPMTRSVLTQEEFNQLKDHFFNTVLLETDIFINTTPEELDQYKKFIEKSGPYDYVLDGLNIALACGKGGNLGKGKSPVVILELFVSNLHRAGFKVLVLGRKHMSRWNKNYINSIKKMSDMFLIDDQSQDDPFMIWATLKSGMNCQIVTRDMMRNHTFRLKNPEMARLFKRWRLSHQKFPIIELKGEGGSVRLQPFADIVPIPQKNKDTGSWHIPYDLDRIISPYDIPKKWLCLTYNQFRK